MSLVFGVIGVESEIAMLLRVLKIFEVRLFCTLPLPLTLLALPVDIIVIRR
jgi:hypothetical protein